MGPLPTAILIGCLNGLQWLLWLAAALLAILVVTETIRGVSDATHMTNLIVAAVLALGGFVCGYAARKFTPT